MYYICRMESIKTRPGIDIIFRCIVGSHAYGTNVEGSDIDEKFIYIQTPEDVLNNGYREQETINKDCVGY